MSEGKGEDLKLRSGLYLCLGSVTCDFKWWMGWTSVVLPSSFMAPQSASQQPLIHPFTHTHSPLPAPLGAPLGSSSLPKDTSHMWTVGSWEMNHQPFDQWLWLTHKPNHSCSYRHNNFDWVFALRLSATKDSGSQSFDTSLAIDANFNQLMFPF